MTYSVRPAVTQVKCWSKKSHSGSSSMVIVEKLVESSRPSLYCVMYGTTEMVDVA